MRFVIGLFALLFASLPLGGNANASAEGKRVMLLGTANTNPYIGAWTSTFSKFATQTGMKVTNLSSNYEAAVQAQQVDDAIAQKFDMIVMVYVNDQAIIPALTRAKAAGIPVDEARRNLLAEKQPQLQFTTTEQIAGLALFLASDTASNMQGAQLVSDGGWTAQ